MASSNFTWDDAIQAARESLQDAAQRRWGDAEILTFVLPRVLQQLRADRPDLFIGLFGAENFKPSQTDPIDMDDLGFNSLVDAIVAAILKQDEESAGSGSAQAADFTSERSRKS